MPINRGPYNALVDDDGSNTVGTQFGKDDIKAVLLDPIDAAIAPVEAHGSWIQVPFSAANFVGGAGLTWTVQVGDVIRYAYTLINKTMVLTVWVTGTTIAGSGAELRVTIPAGKVAYNYALVPAIVAPSFGESGVAFVQPSTGYVSIYRLGQPVFTPGVDTATVIFTHTFEIV